MSMVYIQQNSSEGKNIAYTNKTHPTSTIASSGCGCCSSLMVLLNCTSYPMSLKSWASVLMKGKAREGIGTDMVVVGKIMKDNYGFEYSHTSDLSKLKAHLNAGYKAVAHVGNKGYFNNGGHFVCVAGMTKDGKAIVLDPYYSTGKWTDTVNGINRKKYFTYDPASHEVYCSFSTIEADSRGYKYHLFKPTKKKYWRYSSKDIWASWKNEGTIPVIKPSSGYSKWTGYVTANSSLNVRSGAGTGYSILGSLSKGSAVCIEGESGDWYKITYSGKLGYVHKDYISKKRPASSKIIYKTTVGKSYRLKTRTILYAKGNLSGTTWAYKAGTKVKVVSHYSSTVDKIQVPATGRVAYVKTANLT